MSRQQTVSSRFCSKHHSRAAFDHVRTVIKNYFCVLRGENILDSLTVRLGSIAETHVKFLL